MNLTAKTTLIAILLAASASLARAQQEPVAGTYRTPAGKASINIVAVGDAAFVNSGMCADIISGTASFVMSGTIGGMHVEGKTDGQPTAPLPDLAPDAAYVGTGSWVFVLDADIPNTVGFAGRLDNLESRRIGPNTRTLEVKQVKPKGFEAILRRGTNVLARERLIRERAMLTIHGATSDSATQSAFNVFARQVAAYYKAKGISKCDDLLGTDWEHVIAFLCSAQKAGTVYERVIYVGHGGWDGPYLWGYLGGTSQVSTGENQDLFAVTMNALRGVMTADCKMFSSACHAGGSDRFEAVEPNNSHPKYRWVDDVAAATGRLVAGPMGKTSTEWSLQAVKAALEGEGTNPQETRIAIGSTAHTVPRGGTR